MSIKITSIDSKPTSNARIIKAATQTPVVQLEQKSSSTVNEPSKESGQTNTPVGSKEEATPLDPKFEALARKEASLRSRERELQAKEEALKSKASPVDNVDTFKARIRANPLDVLNEMGITYDQLVEQAVNQPDSNTRAIQEKLSTIEATQKKLAEDAQNSAKAQRESALKQIRYDVEDLIEANPDFETIKTTGSVEDVVELIARTFDESGRLLTVEAAAKMVENELFEEALKLANLGKVKAKLRPDTLAEAVQQTKQQIDTQQATNTLTNSMTSTRPLTARERAIKRFNGEKF